MSFFKVFFRDKSFLIIASLSILFSISLNLISVKTHNVHGIRLFYRTIVVSPLILFSIFWLTSINRVLFAIIVPFIFMLSGIATYFMYYYNIQIRPSTIALVIKTSYGEAIEHIDINLFLFVTLLFTVSIFFVWLYLHTTVKHQFKKYIIVSLISIFLCISLNIRHHDILTRYLPVNIFTQTFSHYYNSYKINKLVRNKTDISTNATQAVLNHNYKNVMVLIIGESVRADHISLNGYHRNTMPLLSKTNNIISFTNVHSCYNNTRISVPCLLTRANRENIELSAKETSIISVFNKVGFYTAWLSNQNNIGINDIITTAIVDEADFKYFNFIQLDEIKFSSVDERLMDQQSMDHQMLPILDNILKENHEKLFIIIHMNGSHWNYSKRYPKRFIKYSPESLSALPTNSNQQHIINAYDNTLIYLDWFVHEVIKRIKPFYSQILYVSDHGESLGDNDIYLHAHATFPEEQQHVAMIWWGSEKFTRENPSIVNKLKSKQHNKLFHRHVFHSLIDLNRINIPSLDKNLSISNE